MWLEVKARRPSQIAFTVNTSQLNRLIKSKHHTFHGNAYSCFNLWNLLVILLFLLFKISVITFDIWAMETSCKQQYKDILLQMCLHFLIFHRNYTLAKFDMIFLYTSIPSKYTPAFKYSLWSCNFGIVLCCAENPMAEIFNWKWKFK